MSEPTIYSVLGEFGWCGWCEEGICTGDRCQRAVHEKMAAALIETRAALTLATQRAEAAEAERENVSSQLWDCTNERDGLRAERDALRKDAAMLADSIEDFIGAQGTAYEADQYLMLCGVVRDYNDRLDAALAVQPSNGAAHE